MKVREATTMGMFKKAVKTSAKLRMALAGPAGSGKTYTALSLALALADGRPVAVVDTERGSASKYADLFAFDVVELAAPYHPDRFVEIIREAEAAGYAVLVIDSLTHAWNGTGGLLETVEQIAKRSYGGNTFRAWAEGTPIQNRLIGAITGAGLHIIATLRSKADHVIEQDQRGKATVRKVGTKVEQRDDVEYEFDIYGDMNQEHELIVRKTRCPQIADAVILKPGKPLAETLRAWLTGTPQPTPAPAPQPTPAPARRFPEPTQDDLDEEDGYLREMAGADAGDGDEATETIPYTPDEDGEPEPKLETPAVLDTMTRQQFLLATAEMGYSPRRVLEVLGVRSLEGLNLAQSFEKIKAIGPTKRAGSSSRTRNIVSPLGATAPAGETVPDLAALGTGTEGRH